MFTFIVTLIVIASLLLILVVLAQNSKGGGLSSQFGGGGATSQVMGVKRTGDLLERLTWGLAIAIFILSLSTNFFIHENVANPGMNSPILEQAEGQTILPPASSTQPIDATAPDASESGLEGLIEEEQK